MNASRSDRLDLYDELASWWPLVSPPSDYAEEAAVYERVILHEAAGSVERVLELGSGGGHNASHLKARFEMVLVDAAPGMLDVSRALNPGCEHVEGDMRTVRLDRVFDAVFVHDAICYMATPSDLRRAIETAWAHCRPGGVALFVPDFVRETFDPSTDHGGSDDGERGLRYVEWTWDPDPSDSSYVVDYAFLLRERDGSVRVAHERHVEGLFARDEWLAAIGEVGFEASLRPTTLEAGETLQIFVGRRPND